MLTQTCYEDQNASILVNFCYVLFC